MKNYKIDFIENPEIFTNYELEKLKGGWCFINLCHCNSGKKKDKSEGYVKTPDLKPTNNINY